MHLGARHTATPSALLPALRRSPKEIRQAVFLKDNMTDSLRFVLKGTFIVPEHFQRVKEILSRSLDEQEMRDRLAKLWRDEPGIFDSSPHRQQQNNHYDDVNAVMRTSNVKPQFFPILKSILRWGTNRQTMTATVETLRTRTAPEWFWSRKPR